MINKISPKNKQISFLVSETKTKREQRTPNDDHAQKV